MPWICCNLEPNQRFAVEGLFECPGTAVAVRNRSPKKRIASARKLALILLSAAIVGIPAHRSNAISGLATVAQYFYVAAPVTRAPILPFTWPRRFNDRLDPGPSPLVASIAEFLRGARDDARARSLTAITSSWSPGNATGNPQYTSELRAADFANPEERRNSFAEQRPDLQDGATGEPNVLRFIHYRLPWLVTPESAVPGLPTLSMRNGDTVSFELMGGAFGGRSGAYGQFVLRF
ncbi:MAG TPA: hypothetical protein VEE84_03155 [Burkholderiaceae bacterium]|nr:hypothetical protein [Burkholderiaceae bacterium]